MWDPELAELKRRKELAELMGGTERVARQHATGRLTIRERLAALTDTWREVGALTGRATDEAFTPANVIIGRARIDGRRVVVAGDDFTVRGGAADAAIGDLGRGPLVSAMGVSPSLESLSGRQRKAV
ncbi:carboxyl transferase domain-containing protein [Nonomuraea zeae]|uniref:Acetyl-coenzyme A carboxylase carboxyl transferase subunit beta domain-containing protein n=1 Tax=Nonomuraea zeae TaxID=1642303 RepID=A0A5S4FPA9_9ACTN|nr:carboxyl transferase domain-containing protein [Nonomuraea zeae]TMR11005.1 hypothetical protein ETD85_59835 [Nonomuraea zeae]